MEAMMRSIHKKGFWKLASPVPPELTLQVGIKGIPDAHFWADELPYELLER
jgi:hypothetical protein